VRVRASLREHLAYLNCLGIALRLIGGQQGNLTPRIIIYRYLRRVLFGHSIILIFGEAAAAQRILRNIRIGLFERCRSSRVEYKVGKAHFLGNFGGTQFQKALCFVLAIIGISDRIVHRVEPFIRVAIRKIGAGPGFVRHHRCGTTR
jgi:hypothetical protein